MSRYYQSLVFISKIYTSSFVAIIGPAETLCISNKLQRQGKVQHIHVTD
jgi:hypothetical protein